MKVPALRSKIGTWTYYVTTLSFEEVSKYVSKIDDQLHKSDSLKDLIQRSITDNHLSITNYILKQPEVFFNALVLAVYDDYPDWREVEFTFKDFKTFNMGLLEFPKQHKIFPVDGQHRVEGIKEALKANSELKNERIAAIFIGHKNDDEGKRRTRRLFTTLNRYAKPVKDDDIIALDEDDAVAITTRYLLEEYELFTGSRVVYAKQKAIPQNNRDAITSIITLYQANIELLKIFYEDRYETKLTQKKKEEFLKFRPDDDVLEDFQQFVLSFWNSFRIELSFIRTYLRKQIDPASSYRNSETGGNLIFRPIGFLPFVKATIQVHRRTNKDFKAIFKRFNQINFNLDSKPWHYVLWNPIEKKVLMGAETVCELLLLYLYDEKLLSKQELSKLKEGYASRISANPAQIQRVLNGIK